MASRPYGHCPFRCRAPQSPDGIALLSARKRSDTHESADLESVGRLHGSGTRKEDAQGRLSRLWCPSSTMERIGRSRASPAWTTESYRPPWRMGATIRPAENQQGTRGSLNDRKAAHKTSTARLSSGALPTQDGCCRDVRGRVSAVSLVSHAVHVSMTLEDSRTRLESPTEVKGDVS